MESAGDQLQKAIHKKNGGDEQQHRRTFIHPCNTVYKLMAASSGILIILGVTDISFWSLRGDRDKAYQWTAFYSMAVLCLVASLWILRSVRAIIYYVRLCHSSDKIKVSVNPDIALPTDD